MEDEPTSMLPHISKGQRLARIRWQQSPALGFRFTP
jgi:hypothetical protein